MICLTIDSEQWNSPRLRGREVEENDNTEFSRLGNENLLKFLDKHHIKATFFVTGFFAEKEPEQIKAIIKLGHEIGCHGYNHHYRNNKKLDLDGDIKKAKLILEKITRRKILGFRAPQMQYSEKLLRTLKKNGFTYDTSLNPAYFPFWVNNKHYSLSPFEKHNVIEIPTAAVPGSRLPLSWLFMRIMPYSYLKHGIKKLLQENITPVLYAHSWEFIKLKSPHVPWHFKKNTGKTFINKLDKLIKDFKSGNFIVMEKIINGFYSL